LIQQVVNFVRICAVSLRLATEHQNASQRRTHQNTSLCSRYSTTTRFAMKLLKN